MSENNCGCASASGSQEGKKSCSQNGKGDSPRHKIDKYAENFGDIKWDAKKKK